MSQVVPSHENDLKLAEIIGMCMGAMTAEGLHALLCEAVLHHQADRRDDRWCEACRGRRSGQ